MTAMSAAAKAATEPGAVQQVAQIADLIVILAAVFVVGRRHRERSTPATGWAFAMFATLASVVIAGFFPVDDDGGLLRHGYTVVLISVLLAFPYLLVRFALSLGAIGPRRHRVAVILTAVQVVATLFSPTFPQPGEPRSGWFTAYIVLILVGWSYQSFVTAAGLWSAGNGQPSVVRHRMRALSTGAVVLALTLVASTGSTDPESNVAVVTTLIGVVSICLLVVAFVVPGWLRAAWRASDLVDLGTAERGLMAALTPQAVAVAIVPAMMRLFGASGAALLDGRGGAVEARGLSRDRIASLHAQLRAAETLETVIVTDQGGFGCRLAEGWLVVQAGGFAPVFGPAELSLLDRIGSFVDLALERCRLFDKEARSKASAEAANAELQTLVYSVSHDLRNPIISVLGYLDVLKQEHAGQLVGEGAHYLERISVNAVYMQNLIQDLLELSRIGRSEPAPQAVELGALAESVAQEVRAMHPACDISVSGDFPVVWMSDLRARQLLTNLVDNAAKHAHGDARVNVAALREDNGGATLFVSDNGKGIPAHYREKAFDVFERLDAAHTDVPGTGMGLPICKRIVESLGGTIVLDGPPAGTTTGTTVRISLPASALRAWVPTPRTAPAVKENAR